MTEDRIARNRIPRRRLLQLGAGTAGFVILSACTSPAGPPTGAGQTAGGVVPREVVIGTPQEVLTLDSQLGTDFVTNLVMDSSVYDALVHIGVDGQYEPALAESWSVVNETTWRYKLRRGVKFHNGEAFNAEAAKFSIDRILNPNTKSARLGNMNVITQVKVVDDFTIELITNGPYAPLNAAVKFGLMVPPKALTENPEILKTQPIGTGALKFVEWKKDQRLVLERNPDYWGAKTTIPRVTFRPIPDASARVAALQAGEVQLITAVPPDQVPVLKTGATKVDTRAHNLIYVGLDALGKNGAPALKDRRVRQAINYGVNKDTLVNDLLGGLAVKNVGGFFPQTIGADKSLQPYPYDPTKAKQLLAEAGYANGFDVTFDYTSGIGGAQKLNEVIESIASDLGKIGLRVKINSLETAAYNAKYRETQQMQMYVFNWISAPEAGLHIRTLLHSSVRGFYYKNQQMDKLIDDWFASLDDKKREEAGRVLHRFIYEEAPFLFLYQQLNVHALHKDLEWKKREDFSIRLPDLSWSK